MVEAGGVVVAAKMSPWPEELASPLLARDLCDDQPYPGRPEVRIRTTAHSRASHVHHVDVGSVHVCQLHDLLRHVNPAPGILFWSAWHAC
ncbi:hypothetical protein BS78_10G226200 [Paspalum vaginatum]|nr:hypothetical protein BS78_10G226200 [Paspalum vaginatum]